jgi:hypothetical protein
MHRLDIDFFFIFSKKNGGGWVGGSLGLLGLFHLSDSDPYGEQSTSLHFAFSWAETANTYYFWTLYYYLTGGVACAPVVTIPFHLISLFVK